MGISIDLNNYDLNRLWEDVQIKIMEYLERNKKDDK